MSGMPKVLIVDDSSVVVEALGRILTNIGFSQIAKTSTAEEAISLQKQSPVEIIFLDINLPGMSGLDALPELKAASKKTKIILVSSSATAYNVKEGIKKGAAGFLAKPFNADNVATALKQIKIRNK